MDTYALHTAAFANDASAVRRLVAEGVDPNSINSKSGLTPLAVAAMRDSVEAAFALLEAGANPNAKMNWRSRVSGTGWPGRTALMSAVGPSLAALLVSRGADVNALDDRGWPVLAHIVNAGNVSVAAQLVSLGAKTSATFPRNGKILSFVTLIDDEVAKLQERIDAIPNPELLRLLAGYTQLRTLF